MARQRPPFWLILAAAAYLAYFTLLIYCHVHRPDQAQLNLQFTIAAGLPDAAAGLSRAQLDGFNLTLPPGAASFDLGRDAVLYGFRLVQLITLVLGIALAFRKPRDPVALSGAWLLATAGVFSVALPAGWAAAWQALPVPAGLPLWFPFLSTIAGGAILFHFAARFTRDERANSRFAAVALILLLGGPLFMRAMARMSLVYRWDAPAALWDHTLGLVLTNAVAAVVSIAVLFRHYSGARDLVEKRRARLVLTGGSIGMVAGIAVMLATGGSGPDPGRSLFASTSITVGTLLFLLLPVSLSYAILRYRLFGFRAAIRSGLRYAVARRALLSIVPIAAAALVFDVWSYGDRPLREILSARSGLYLIVAAAAVAAHLTRHRWLDQLDRTFFRERYDATRILMDLVGEIRSARGFEEVAALAIGRIERALHPTFAIVGTAVSGGASLTTSAAFRPEKAPALPPASWVLMELARVLRRPLDVAPDSSAWLSERLPESEVRYLRDGRVELLVPITAAGGGVDAVMLLGAKQSEEPYTREDRELLGAIADSLALALTQAGAPPPRLQDVELPRVVGGRYRLERVIGRGGMGIVYEARDLTLDRNVAVKLMRDELLGAPDARRRFEDEARAAAGFSHPNVITVFDFDAAEGGTAMIVMELLEGHTLRAELARAPMPSQRALWIVGSMAGAVDAAHARGLLHRDLKPENVFVAREAPAECVKILDFGIARPLSDSPESRGAATLDGALIGTPRYMAPEQLAGGLPARSWDLWALAVMTCEMLTGAHPFAGPRPAAAGSPALDDFFRRALAPRAGERFSSAGEMSARLAEALGATPV